MTPRNLATIKQALTEQGRRWDWLARVTNTKARTVYSYTSGERQAPEEWLRKAREALGIDQEGEPS